MSLKKRIEKLELLQKQRDCIHSTLAISVASENNCLRISSKCWICKKETSRLGKSEELESAATTLRDFLFEAKHE